MKSLYRKMLLWLMHTHFYENMLLKVIPFIRFTTYYTKMRGWKYHKGYEALQKGDIILTVDKKKLTSVLIPGEFSHAALCVSKDKDWEISEMTHSNYTKSTFFDICKESDRVMIVRCKDWDADYIERVTWACKALDGAKYDTDFKLGVKALYCSELVYESDVEKRLQISLEDLAGLGRPYISPTGLYKAKNIVVVWDSDAQLK